MSRTVSRASPEEKGVKRGNRSCSGGVSSEGTGGVKSFQGNGGIRGSGTGRTKKVLRMGRVSVFRYVDKGTIVDLEDDLTFVVVRTGTDKGNVLPTGSRAVFLLTTNLITKPEVPLTDVRILNLSVHGLKSRMETGNGRVSGGRSPEGRLGGKRRNSLPILTVKGKLKPPSYCVTSSSKSRPRTLHRSRVFLQSTRMIIVIINIRITITIINRGKSVLGLEMTSSHLSRKATPCTHNTQTKQNKNSTTVYGTRKTR